MLILITTFYYMNLFMYYEYTRTVNRVYMAYTYFRKLYRHLGLYLRMLPEKTRGFI